MGGGVESKGSEVVAELEGEGGAAPLQGCVGAMTPLPVWSQINIQLSVLIFSPQSSFFLPFHLFTVSLSLC